MANVQIMVIVFNHNNLVKPPIYRCLRLQAYIFFEAAYHGKQKPQRLMNPSTVIQQVCSCYMRVLAAEEKNWHTVRMLCGPYNVLIAFDTKCAHQNLQYPKSCSRVQGSIRENCRCRGKSQFVLGKISRLPLQLDKERKLPVPPADLYFLGLVR